MEKSLFLHSTFSLVIAESSHFYLFVLSIVFATEVRGLVKYPWTFSLGLLFRNFAFGKIGLETQH